MVETIATVVVTYNRRQLVTQCLEALIGQTRPVQRIILLDNASADGTDRLLEERGYLTNPIIEYIRFPRNLGGAAGFREGMKRAYEAGYDWVWMMDDDVTPAADCLERLLEIHRESGGAYRILQPARVDAETGRTLHYATRYNFRNPFEFEGCDRIIPSELNVPYAEIVSPPFEGPLIHRSVIADVGEVDSGFFMVCDDADYFLRAYRKGFRPVVVRDAVMRRANAAKKAMFFDWKDYYTLRNRVELDRRYGGRWIAMTRVLHQALRLLVRSLSRKRRGKLQGCRLILRALVDGLKGRRGETVPPPGLLDP